VQVDPSPVAMPSFPPLSASHISSAHQEAMSFFREIGGPLSFSPFPFFLLDADDRKEGKRRTLRCSLSFLFLSSSFSEVDDAVQERVRGLSEKHMREKSRVVLLLLSPFFFLPAAV